MSLRFGIRGAIEIAEDSGTKVPPPLCALILSRI
jgi:hypothetical protein